MTQGRCGALLEAFDAQGASAHAAVATAEPTTPGRSDTELVRRAREGDAIAFDRLAAARLDRAYRLAVAIMRSEADASDAVQEAFVAAWRQLPRLRDPERFDAWLERIVVNACRMALRHRGVVRLREIDVSDPEASPSGLGARLADPAPAAADAIADAELVRRSMDRLDGDKRAILVLFYVQDRSVGEIASALGIPAGTVKWRLHAARAALERAYQEEAR
jgi:RNA polymerase sigma-70 factor (ECF subfamily)